jgi:hypothetical protein
MMSGVTRMMKSLKACARVDRRLPARQAFHLGNNLLRLGHDGQDALAVQGHLAPGLGETDLLAHLLEQRQPHPLLELLDLHGHDRLGQVQAPRRRG